MSDEAEQIPQTDAGVQAAGPDSAVKPNLEAIMHVPLEISVELGRVQLPLHAVARLHRGAIVDLKKEANTEVEILANGQVFARGEVVSADGKLGVRVVEVVPAGDRIRSLG
ncbi:MAG: FliM/FliN family flagellar motor switch protein [Mariprofundaceae bacterium]